jgi:hypothetical protein
MGCRSNTHNAFRFAAGSMSGDLYWRGAFTATGCLYYVKWNVSRRFTVGDRRASSSPSARRGLTRLPSLYLWNPKELVCPARKSVPRQPDLTTFRATPARLPRLQPTEMGTPGTAQSPESAPFG